jgi:hypothetical protein
MPIGFGTRLRRLPLQICASKKKKKKSPDLDQRPRSLASLLQNHMDSSLAQARTSGSFALSPTTANHVPSDIEDHRCSDDTRMMVTPWITSLYRFRGGFAFSAAFTVSSLMATAVNPALLILSSWHDYFTPTVRYDVMSPTISNALVGQTIVMTGWCGDDTPSGALSQFSVGWRMTDEALKVVSSPVPVAIESSTLSLLRTWVIASSWKSCIVRQALWKYGAAERAFSVEERVCFANM